MTISDFKLKEVRLPLALILCNGLIGHFFPPIEIILTPILIIAITLFIVFDEDTNIFIQSILLYFFIALNDIIIKLYSGGSHDSEGYGWIHGALFLGLIPALGIYAIKLWQNKEETTQNKLLAMGLLVLLLVAHLSEFDDLGLGRYY